MKHVIMYINFFALLVLVGAAPIDKRVIVTVTEVATVAAPIANQNTVNNVPVPTVPNVQPPPNTAVNNPAPANTNNPETPIKYTNTNANTPAQAPPPANTPAHQATSPTTTQAATPSPPSAPSPPAAPAAPYTPTAAAIPTTSPTAINTPTTLVQPSTAPAQLSQFADPTENFFSGTSPASLAAPSSSFAPVASVPSDSFGDTLDKVYHRFWLSSNNAWNDKDSLCGTPPYNSPVVWTQATIAMAVINQGDQGKIAQAMGNLYKYQNAQTGAFSASPSGDTDLYSDDNAQVAWAFIEAYKVTHNQQYLQTARRIFGFLVSQWDSRGVGGIIWKYNNPYVSSISTVETALTAMKLYEITSDPNLVFFAENCMSFMFQYLQDPLDHLFYDGFSDINSINKGKLTYTVGVALSTLARLSKSSSDLNWLRKANELASAATNPNGVFYGSDGKWNNAIKYVYLLYTGFADIMQLGGQFAGYQQEVLKQGNFVYNYLQDPQDTSMYFSLIGGSTLPMVNRFQSTYKKDDSYKPDPSRHCNDDPNEPATKNLMDNASAAHILYQLNRIA